MIMTSVKSRKKQLEEENRDLKQEVADLENKQELQKEGKRRCLKCDDYKRKLSQVKQDYQELQDKFNVARTNAQNTGRDVHDLREQIESEKSNIKSLQRKVENLEREKFSAESTLHGKESELSQVRGELGSLDRRITGLQDENTDLNRRCKSREEGLIKMDAELRQLKTQNRQLKADFVTLRQERATLVTKLELQEKLRSTKDLQCEQCPVLHREIESLKKRIDEQNERDCPNGEESNTSTLCDPERPSRLCATFRDIFHGSWNDAYEHLTETDDETTAIHNLLGVVQNSYKFGEGVFNQYLTALNEALVGPCRDKEISKNIQLMNLNYAKRMAKLVKDDIVELYISTTEYKSAHPVIQTFCTEVVGICWRFLCQDPPLKLLIDPGTRPFNTDWFDEYKHKGRSMAYVVWPVVYREENGEKDVLSKGIAEAK